MIDKDDLYSKEIQDDFIRLLNKAVQAGKSLEEYLQDVSLNSEEKEAILEYQKKLEEKRKESVGGRARFLIIVAILLFVMVIVSQIGTGISDYYKNQRQEKIGSEEKAKQAQEMKELDRKIYYKACKRDAEIDYISNWNRSCESLGEMSDCKLPHVTAERWDKLYKEGQEQCYKEHLQNL